MPGTSGVARAFPGGRLAHPKDQSEGENEESLRKKRKTERNLRKKLEKWKSCPPGTVRLATALPGTIVLKILHKRKNALTESGEKLGVG